MIVIKSVHNIHISDTKNHLLLKIFVCFTSTTDEHDCCHEQQRYKVPLGMFLQRWCLQVQRVQIHVSARVPCGVYLQHRGAGGVLQAEQPQVRTRKHTNMYLFFLGSMHWLIFNLLYSYMFYCISYICVCKPTNTHQVSPVLIVYHYNKQLANKKHVSISWALWDYCNLFSLYKTTMNIPVLRCAHTQIQTPEANLNIKNSLYWGVTGHLEGSK